MRKASMLSLKWKLALAFLLVVVVSVGVTAGLIGQSIDREFGRYVEQRGAGNAGYPDDGSSGAAGSPHGPQISGAEQDFLNSMNTSLWIAALAGGGVAVLLGVGLALQVTRPVRQLKRGAARIASGDLSYRVPIATRDELGDLAKSFNSMAASLDASEKARQRLLADIAHDLRTPLSVIEGTVDAILDGVFEPTPENLGSIREEARALTRLVADLRELSLADSGQLKLEVQPTDVAELIRQRLDQIGVIARERGIALDTDLPDGLPQCPVDARRVEQVIVNLVDNALKHTPAGGSIRVALGRAAGGRELLVTVADTGEGIPAKQLPHVFERFYRGDEARSRTSGGAGLGLAIARQIVELHHGRIWAESEVGKGSTFSFTLPTCAGASPR